MTLYVINAPILTDYGLWEFVGPLTISEAKRKLAGGFVSAIGHDASASVLSKILKISIPVDRIQVKMLAGDEALILRLLQRLPEGKVLDETELQKLDFDLCLLKRLR